MTNKARSKHFHRRTRENSMLAALLVAGVLMVGWSMAIAAGLTAGV